MNESHNKYHFNHPITSNNNMRQIIEEHDGKSASNNKKRTRWRRATSCMILPSSSRTARISRIAGLCAILSTIKVDAFSPSQFQTQTHALSKVPSHHHPPHHQTSPHRSSSSTNNSSTSRSPTRPLTAASAWLFTPDKTSSVLADTATTTILTSAHTATDAALEVAAHAVDIASTVTTDTVVQTIYKAPFLSLALSFLLGGLFFSTVAAFFAGFIALGKKNTRRLQEVMGILYRRNWSVMKLSMQLTMDVLRGKEEYTGIKNRFVAALQTAKDGVAEVKRVFTESVDAIKKETQMYSAAVGVPGLIPIQYIFDRLFPTMLTAPFKASLQDVLLNTQKENSQIRKLLLKDFTMGDIAPKVLEARLFDLGTKDMAFDLETVWKSDAKAELELRVSSFGAKIPVTIQNLRFEGPVRLIIVGLSEDEPGYRALLISLPRPPKIGFDLKVAGGLITQIPWLRNEMERMIDTSVAAEVLWPRRAVVSAPSPFKSKPLLNPMQILSLMRDDPLLRMERDLMASIPDDFSSIFEAPSQEDIPDFDIRQFDNDTKESNRKDDRNEGSGGGTPHDGQMRNRLRPWKWNKQAATVESVTVDALQLMAQTLQQEAAVGKVMPVMVLEGVVEKKSVFRRALKNVLLPKSLLSYAVSEY